MSICPSWPVRYQWCPVSVMPTRSAEVLPRSVVNFVICGLLLLLRLHRLHLLRPRHHLLLLDAA